jgi:hypothetical protein
MELVINSALVQAHRDRNYYQRRGLLDSSVNLLEIP